MDKKINKGIIKTVKRYLDAVSKDYHIEGAFLFGSYANGTNRAESDIDVAILLNNIDNRFLARVNLGKYTWDVDTRIEPHPIQTDEYKNRESILARELVKSGIRII